MPDPNPKGTCFSPKAEVIWDLFPVGIQHPCDRLQLQGTPSLPSTGARAAIPKGDEMGSQGWEMLPFPQPN